MTVITEEPEIVVEIEDELPPILVEITQNDNEIVAQIVDDLPAIVVEMTDSIAPIDVAIENDIPPVVVVFSEIGLRGPPGAAGQGSVIHGIASESINAFTVVVIDPDGSARLASSNDNLDGPAVVGIASTAALTGEDVEAVVIGEMLSDSVLPIGPLYLNVDGSLTSNPDTGSYQLRIGYAITTSRLLVRFETPIFHS